MTRARISKGVQLKKATKIVSVAGIAAVVTMAGVGGAVAGSKITGADIARSTILGYNVHNSTLNADKLTPSARAFLRGRQGLRGVAGKNGKSGLAGAYYATATYNVGDTNGGAIATVACQSQSDTAIAGGVQTLGLDGGSPATVSSSFPGRMDWTTNTPKPGRLDGWIVQFDSTTAPAKTTLWALCVPNLSNVPVVNTYTESG